MGCAGIASSRGTRKTTISRHSLPGNNRLCFPERLREFFFLLIREFRALWRRRESGFCAAHRFGLFAWLRGRFVPQQKFWEAREKPVFARATECSTPRSRRLRSALWRECALRDHLYQPRAAVVLHAVYHGSQRAGLGQSFRHARAAEIQRKQPDPNIDWSQFEPISGMPNYAACNRIPYAEEYMLSLQRGFGANTVLSMNYVGTQGHRLLVLVEANPGDPALCLRLSNPANFRPGSPTCGPFGEDNVFTTASGQVSMAPADRWDRISAAMPIRRRPEIRITTLCRSACGIPADA